MLDDAAGVVAAQAADGGADGAGGEQSGLWRRAAAEAQRACEDCAACGCMCVCVYERRTKMKTIFLKKKKDKN